MAPYGRLKSLVAFWLVIWRRGPNRFSGLPDDKVCWWDYEIGCSGTKHRISI